MEYIVQPQDTLSGIAEKTLGSAQRWPEIAHLNHISPHEYLYIGTSLRLPIGARLARPGFRRVQFLPAQFAAQLPERRATLVPARAFFFVIADEFNPLAKKVVRKVIYPVNVNQPEALRRLLRPDLHGFQPREPAANVSLGRHVLGMTNSRYVSASERMLGSSRFDGPRYWIDVAKVQASGGKIYDASAIGGDLDRIAAKAANPRFRAYIEDIRQKSVVIDREVLIEGSVSAGAVKTATTMAMTRGLQFIQGAGILLTAYDLGSAGIRSVHQRSARPIAGSIARNAGGWWGALQGAEIAGSVGVALGIETGPGAIVTGLIGALAGGCAGYFGADFLLKAGHLDERQ